MVKRFGARRRCEEEEEDEGEEERERERRSDKGNE